MLALNLAWEAAHARLYTLWQETPLAQWLILPPLALYLGRAALSPADRSA